MTGMQAALLDNIRISNGPDSLRSYFHELLHTDREKLLVLLNDRNLRFRSLYILKQDIAVNSLMGELPSVYRKALEIADELSEKTGSGYAAGPSRQTSALTSQRTRTMRAMRSLRATRATRSNPAVSASDHSYREIEKRMRLNTQEVLPALEWIVDTGWDDEPLRAAYELLLERCTSLILKDFRKCSVLPAVADTIFSRNRQGKLIHNLVWAFFEACDPDSLYLIAQRLNSADSSDTTLAKKLLCFIPGLDEAAGTGAYIKAMQWLSENRPFLCYTGETMQMCSRPVYYTVSQEAKYLCRPLSASSGKLLSPLQDSELKLLEEFRKQPEALQKHLADFSCMLHRRDLYQWAAWIRLSVVRQAETVSKITGGLA